MTIGPTGPLADIWGAVFDVNPFIGVYDSVVKRTDDRNLPWDASYSGWGGWEYFTSYSDRPTPVWSMYDGVSVEHEVDVGRNPVVFVHGNGRNADDWVTHADFLRERGFSGDELWAITFQHPTSTHEEMAEQLDDFVRNVRSYTGWPTVDVVSHSLGVTGARYWLETCDRYEWVDTFIGIGGANHGLLPTGVLAQEQLLPARYRQIYQFLRRRADVPADINLNELNKHETPGDIDYYTIRGQYDQLFMGNKDSPMLDGAIENRCLTTDHYGIRDCGETLNLMHEWLTDS